MAADTAELMSHVKDSDSFHFPVALGGHVHVPQPFEAMGIPLHLTKFMVLELVAAILILIIFIPLARRIARGGPPKGRFWNFFEVMLVFMRDEVARPAIGRARARGVPGLRPRAVGCAFVRRPAWCGGRPIAGRRGSMDRGGRRKISLC